MYTSESVKIVGWLTVGTQAQGISLSNNKEMVWSDQSGWIEQYFTWAWNLKCFDTSSNTKDDFTWRCMICSNSTWSSGNHGFSKGKKHGGKDLKLPLEAAAVFQTKIWIATTYSSSQWSNLQEEQIILQREQITWGMRNCHLDNTHGVAEVCQLLSKYFIKTWYLTLHTLRTLLVMPWLLRSR